MSDKCFITITLRLSDSLILTNNIAQFMCTSTFIGLWFCAINATCKNVSPIFLIVNFPFICSNIPAAPTFGVCIYQSSIYSRACGSYQDFLEREFLLTRKLLNQGFTVVNMKTSLRKFYGLHRDFVNRYGVTNDLGYVQFVVITILSFHHSWLITGLVTWVTYVEDELFSFRKYLGSTWFLKGFVLSSSDYPFCISNLFSLRSILLVEKIGLPGENQGPPATSRLQKLSQLNRTHPIIGDKPNFLNACGNNHMFNLPGFLNFQAINSNECIRSQNSIMLVLFFSFFLFVVFFFF